MKRYIPILLLVVFCAALPAQAQLTPQVAIGDMGRGINMGNTLEPPQEGGWNNGPAEEHYFDDYKAAGFGTVRIPVRWDEHTGRNTPFAVDAAWMDRVEQVVDWALARDLYVVLNAHHEDWLKQDYANDTLRIRFDRIWTQIAERFKDKSEKLFFEIINEPKGMTREEVDDLNVRILSIIRVNNPTRIVIYSGAEWSAANDLMTAAIPNDPYLMGYFHAYNPWNFAGLGEGTWGTEQQRAEVSDMFQEVADWSADTGIPVNISEFGAVRETDYNSRMAFYALYVEESIKHNIAFQVWDDGGMFQVYQRDTRGWNDEKDTLLNTYLDSPTHMTASVVGDTLVTLAWENRTTQNARIIVERRQQGTDAFTPIAELPKDATTYADTTAEGGFWYQYRVVSEFGRGGDRYGYPVQVFAPPTERTNFLGAPFIIPGTIEAEDFDEGGEGLTYHDTDPNNIPGVYRPNVGVDIEPRDDGGYQVAYIESGEWLEYTIDVQEAGAYGITTYLASLEGGGRFRYRIGRNRSPILVPPSTGSWQTLTTVNTTMDLEAGEQVLRLELLTARPFNVDKFTFELLSPTANAPGEVPEDAFAVYPNPAQEVIQVAFDHTALDRSLDIFNMLGQRVRTEVLSARNQRMSVDGLPAGLYLLRFMADDQVVAQGYLVKQ